METNMQSLFAIKNETSFPVISVFIDEKRIFTDILKNEMSEYAFLECGSAALLVCNNFDREIFNEWIFIPPYKKLVITVCDGNLKFT